MSKVTKLLVAGWLVGSLIYACSPGPSHLLHNKTTWELREQLVFLTGVWAMSFMVLPVVVSARFEIVNHLAYECLVLWTRRNAKKPSKGATKEWAAERQIPLR